jgi:hypothetical protein
LQRWQQLRGAALAIESEIWKFRTRTGSYSQGVRSSHIQEEDVLLEFLEQMKQHVYKSASVMDTAFYSQVEAVSVNSANIGKYRHGQYQHARTDGSFAAARTGGERNLLVCLPASAMDSDDFHSPVTPSEYLVFRAVRNRSTSTSTSIYFHSHSKYKFALSVHNVLGFGRSFLPNAPSSILPQPRRC